METMTHEEIRAKLRAAEQEERDALRHYSRNPSEEARYDVQHATKSVRWWSLQVAICNGEEMQEADHADR